MKTDYQYPLDLEWSTQEMVAVVAMWDKVEQAYEVGVKAEEFLLTHKNFKQVVKSIGEERRLGKQFEELSGYSLYRVLKEAQSKGKGIFKMKE